MAFVQRDYQFPLVEGVVCCHNGVARFRIAMTNYRHTKTKGGRLAAFIIAVDCYTNLHDVEPAAGVEPATF